MNPNKYIMRPIELSVTQSIVNKANWRRNFTHPLYGGSPARYVVGTKNLFKGVNPSLAFDLSLRIHDAINSNVYDSIGGWEDEDGIYYLDANVHYFSEEEALKEGKNNKQKFIWDQEEELLMPVDND
jgi:hypothetical protein